MIYMLAVLSALTYGQLLTVPPCYAHLTGVENVLQGQELDVLAELKPSELDKDTGRISSDQWAVAWRSRVELGSFW